MRDRKMTKIKTVLFIFVTLQVSFIQALELKNLVHQVVETNPEIKKIQYELNSEYEDLLSSQKFPNTSLDLYGGAGGQRNFDYTLISDKDFDKYNAGIKLTHKLFDGYYAESETDRYRASYDAKKFMLTSTQQNVTLETIELFLEILKLDEIAALSNKFLGDLILYIEMSSDKLDSGVLNATEHSVVQMSYQIARNNNINAINNLKDTISLYEQSIGSFPPLSMMKYEDIDKNKLPQSLQSALKLAKQNHPVIAACKEHIKETKAQYDGSFSRDYPELEFVLSADWQKNMKNTQKRERVVSAMFNINYNLLGKNNNTHYNEKYKNQVSQAKTLCEIKEREVNSSLKLSYAAFETMSLSQRYLSEAKKSSTAITNSYVERSEVETISFEKLIQRSNQKLETEILEIKNRYDLVYSKYRVLHGMGLLLKHFDMNQHASQR